MIDYNKFGMLLIFEFERVYFESGKDMKVYGEKIYSIWRLLPQSIQQLEAFWTMSYGDDPLSWGDEPQTRRIYEEMFGFYKYREEGKF